MKIKPIASNMTELNLRNGSIIVLFSYQTPVAANINGRFYKTSKKWSVTTSKHINKWLCGAHAEERYQDYFDNLVNL